MKSIQVANQNPLSEENTGLRPTLMTMAQEQKGQANLSEGSTNEKSSSIGAISPLQNPSALATQLQIPQSYDGPQIEKCYEILVSPIIALTQRSSDPPASHVPPARSMPYVK
ncbi:hypothetical protein DSO57_1006846 [Entomophthora muscae]|uniref:Uncharacterized protein n=1 Tax=Entomophthora muscae TaxID=34485 RepID=A0ACC2SK86_9FUNG|nr:hypothetical protein DSO57_1006846 [Entomophthora muscae]